MTTSRSARVNLRLLPESKQAIEAAAALSGQTVSDFAISTLAQTARTLIQEQRRTALSKRDRDVFIRLLDRTDAKPNKALAVAARRYKLSVPNSSTAKR